MGAMPLRADALGGLAGAAVALAAAWTVHDYGLLGVDTYPIVLTSRVGSWGDLLDVLTSRFMGDLAPGAFYRPVASLSFALDYAWGGLRPLGYQLTDAALFGLVAWALWGLVRRAAGPEGSLPAAAACAFFALHPAHVEVLPVPARRAELLAALGLVLALRSHLAAGSVPAARRVFATGGFALLGMASKETALAAPLLGLTVGAVRAPATPPAARASRAVREGLPYLAAAGLFLAARWLVLGGLGGYDTTEPVAALRRLPSALVDLAASLAAPQPLLHGDPLLWLALAMAVGGGLAAGLARGRAAPSAPAAARLAALGAVWVLGVAAIYGTGDELGAWYVTLAVPGWALLAAATLVAARSGWRRAGPSGVPGGVAALGLVALLALHARFSPLVLSYPQWENASRASTRYLERLERRVRRASAPARLRLHGVPYWVHVDRSRPTVRAGAVLEAHSLEAWARLRFPERRIRVRSGRAGSTSAARNRLLLVVESRRLVPAASSGPAQRSRQ